MHWKFLQVVPDGQLPHVPPHPSLPQAFPPHVGLQNEGQIQGFAPEGSGFGTLPGGTQSYHCLLGIQPQPVAHSSQTRVPASQKTLVVGAPLAPLQHPTFSMSPQAPPHTWAQPSAAGRRRRKAARAMVLNWGIGVSLRVGVRKAQNTKARSLEQTMGGCPWT